MGPSFYSEHFPRPYRPQRAGDFKQHREETIMYKTFFGRLYVQVLIGVIAGGVLGYLYPKLGADLKPLGDLFIRLIKMVFAPVIFAMVVLGIAKMESLKELGRVGCRALIYFELMSTFALLIGLVVVNLAHP